MSRAHRIPAAVSLPFPAPLVAGEHVHADPSLLQGAGLPSALRVAMLP